MKRPFFRVVPVLALAWGLLLPGCGGRAPAPADISDHAGRVMEVLAPLATVNRQRAAGGDLIPEGGTLATSDSGATTFSLKEKFGDTGPSRTPRWFEVPDGATVLHECPACPSSHRGGPAAMMRAGWEVWMLFLRQRLHPRAAHHGPAGVALAGLAVLAVAAASCLGTRESRDTTRNADASEFTLTIAENAISGGKSAASADWITNWVIPEFIRDQKAKGRTARVVFQPSGAADEDYKTRLALDLKTRSGADIYSVDGIWVGELAEAGYIEPLADLVGKAAVDAWEGWAQIPPAVQGNLSYDGKRYGVPSGTDGRVLYFNKKLFARAGLPVDWQPTSWDELIAAGRKLEVLPGVTPIQLNAGTAMGEATTMQGILPLLAGAGRLIWEEGRWRGDTPAMRDALAMYERVYGAGLGDPVLQQDARGRDKSFHDFAAGKIAILLESDYFWRSVIDPAGGIAKMPDRDETVGYALIPARKPGGGIRGQDFVSMSGGGGHVLNPATRFPSQAWELLQFMSSKEATIALLAGGARVTQRQDVNEAVLGGDPLLSFVAHEVLPITAFRPGLAVYPRVSQALQQATLDVVTGTTPAEAAAAYHRTIEPIVGGAGKVASD